jgi:tyrosine-protein phosphatase SIW14
MSFPSRGLALLCLCGISVWAADPTSVPGIQNFHQVNQHVYRGAQPSAAGIKYLATLGVKVVLDLRESGDRSIAEERMVSSAGMKYVNVPMSGLTAPTREQIAQTLALLENETAGPVFVHCKRGADRTGAVIAAYRIDHDSWDNARALNEAVSDHMSPMQFSRKQFIRTFQGKPAPAVATQDASAAAPAAKN